MYGRYQQARPRPRVRVPTALPAFAVATLAMLLVPGPSVLYLVARSVQDGRGCGLIAMLGVEVGALVHAITSACGLGAILASTPWALAVIRFGGAGYLLFMGIQQLRSSRSTVAEIGSPPTFSPVTRYMVRRAMATA